jgi:PAS domain S-box-containing protein
VDSLHDIRQRLAELDDPVALLEGIFAAAPVGFQIYDANGRSLLVNQAFREMFGSEPPPEYNVLEDEIAQANGVIDLVHRAFKGETVRIPAIWYDPRDLRQVKVESGKRVAIEPTFFPLFDKQARVSHVAIVFKDVTTETAAEDALRDTQRQLEDRVAKRTAELAAATQALAEAQGLAAIGSWDLDLRTGTAAWSPELCRIFGVEPITYAPSYENFLTLVHPEDRERARAEMRDALDGTGRLDYEYRIIRPDGEVRHVHTRGSVVRDADGTAVRVFGTVQDVSERWQSEQERAALVRAEAARSAAEAAGQRASFLARAGSLLASSLDYDTTLRNVIALVLPTLGDFGFFDIVEPDGTVRRLSGAHDDPERRAILEPTSWVRSDRSDINLCALSSGRPALHTDVDEDWLRKAAASEEQLAVMRRLTFRSMLTVPLLYEDRCHGALTLFRAASSRAHTADDLAVAEELAQRAASALQNARLYADLRTSEARAQLAVEASNEASRRKDEFLAMLAHELRNPLAPILSAVQLLQLRSAPDVPYEVSLIERQVQHLNRLVDQLLDVSRVLHGKVELQKEPVHIVAVLSEALDAAHPLLEERGHHISMDASMQKLTVFGDRVRLVQTVTNLLVNAGKYTPPGGRIALSAEAEGSEIVIRVSDNGAGMSEELRAHVFEPFVQGERTLDRSQGGLGLGLALVRSMVELHGGTVSASSAGAGLGSTFTIKLPSISPATSAPVTDETVAALHQADHGPRRRVLIVEDNQDAADVMQRVVELAGHETRVASDGATALSLVQAGFEPDVAFLDIGLPGMDGFELARQLRSRCGERLRLIAVSGYGQDSDRLRSREAGFAEHLVKPVGIAELHRALERPPPRPPPA